MGRVGGTDFSVSSSTKTIKAARAIPCCCITVTIPGKTSAAVEEPQADQARAMLDQPAG
jgi:hypothetical protein